MPDTNRIVINTAPIISLIAALEDLTVLQSLYNQVLVPFEVCQEIRAGGASGFAVAEFEAANWLQKTLHAPVGSEMRSPIHGIDLINFYSDSPK